MLLSGVVLLGLAGRQNRMLQQAAAPAVMLPERGLPPVVATVMLAGFRCIAADILWLRAADLQDNGSYFELVQLADLITELEPHFTTVWAVQAWNMAYNISVMMPDNADRWRWIKSGVALLRDRGIPANANDPYLYSELAFMFTDKIGNPSIPQSQYYTIQWVQEMMKVLGKSGYPDYDAIRQNPEKLRLLVDEYKLIPEKMQEIDRMYGPLDWRLPHTHALYWAYLGLQVSISNGRRDRVCERALRQTMATLFNSGKLTTSDAGSLFVTSVNFELLPKVIATFEDALKNAEDDLSAAAYKNFLSGAVRTLAFYNHNEDARKLFDKLHAMFPDAATARGFDSFVKHAVPSLPQIITPQ
jgi:hypothetical protein